MEKLPCKYLAKLVYKSPTFNDTDDSYFDIRNWTVLKNTKAQQHQHLADVAKKARNLADSANKQACFCDPVRL